MELKSLTENVASVICGISNRGNIVSSSKIPISKGILDGLFYQHQQERITSTELSRKLDLKQKVCWLFKRKVMIAMESSGDFPLKGVVEVDETF